MMAPEQLSLLNNGSTSEEKVSVTSDYFKFYIKNQRRVIVPVENEETNNRAIERLEQLRSNSTNIPKRYLDNWENVKLYSPQGNVDNATALLLHVDEGAYDINNPLNDMTGKEWTKFTCSWFIFNALHSDLKEEREVTSETQSHPATFSPTMVSEFIKFFTKEGQSVVDPFAGIGSTLVGCKRTGRLGYGIELNKKYYDIIKLRVPEFIQNIYNWDSTKLDELDLPTFDFSISSPPYWDVLNRSTDGFRKSRNDRGLDVNYSEADSDLGNVSNYDDFLKQVCSVYEKLYVYMRKGAYIVIIVKNVKKGGRLFPLAWDMARALGKTYTLKDEKLWIQDKIGLSPYGYPHSWASNILHHYCLVFRKE